MYINKNFSDRLATPAVMLSDILRFGSCKNVQMELVFNMSDCGVRDATQSQVQTRHGRAELTEGAKKSYFRAKYKQATLENVQMLHVNLD